MGYHIKKNEKRGAYRALVVKPKEKKDHREDLGLGGRIIINWIFKE
jgi:hypothetical protein